MTFNPGIDTFDQPLRDAWWTQGWTAQNQSYIPVPPNVFSEQGFPPGLTYVTVSGNYFDLDGNFLSGYLTFWPSSAISITETGGTAYLPQRFVGLNNSFQGLNSFGNGRIYLWNGQLNVSLLATDNSNMTPSTFSYHVVEHFFEGNQYDITVPSASSSPVDIHSLIIPGSIRPNNAPLTDEPPIASLTIAAVSTEYVPVNITSMVGGLATNPTSFQVYFAFKNNNQEPQQGDWHQGSWASNSGPPFIAQCLVGPVNGVVLATGTYTIWVMVVATPQVPVISVGTLNIV